MSPNDSKLKHVRKKTWKPKVKTGCVTCRFRRVKCDEAKPQCRRCTSTGRKCDGYTDSSSTEQALGVSALSRQSTPTLAISALPLNSIEEQETFYFFRQRTAVELSGLFDASFWQSELLQASQSQPAVRHAVIAVGAMHRKFVDGHLPVVPDDVSDARLRFALLQSNQAIQEILQSPRRRTIADKIEMMTHCILFNCLACLQGHQTIAFEHLRSGLRILREIDEDLAAGVEDSIAHPVSLETLRAIFINMDVQARSILSEELLITWEPQPKRDITARETPFQSVREARFYFEATFNDMLLFMQGVEFYPPRTGEDITAVEQKLSQVRRQFDAGSVLLEQFLSNPATKIDWETRIGVRLIHDQIKAWLRFFRGNPVNHVNWLMEEEDLRGIVDLASELLGAPPDLTLPPGAMPSDFYPWPADNHTSSGPVQSLASPIFFSGSGVLSALWIVCSRAKGPALRRRAVALLLYYPRREGVWDSVLAGRIAWEAIMLEEASSHINTEPPEIIDPPGWPEQVYHIPDSNRILDINISYTGLRVAVVEFRNVKQYNVGELGVRRHIAW